MKVLFSNQPLVRLLIDQLVDKLREKPFVPSQISAIIGIARPRNAEERAALRMLRELHPKPKRKRK